MHFKSLFCDKMSRSGGKSMAIVYFSHKSYCAGNIGSALIQSCGIDLNFVVTAQVFGHLFVDTKWSKSKSADELVLSDRVLSMHKSLTLPAALNNSNESVCIYSTPLEVLPIEALIHDAVCIQFEIPVDIMPSFRGLCCTITYNLCISFGQPNIDGLKHVYFPFTVFGKGNAAPYNELRYSNLTVLPLTSIPCEALLSQPAIEDDYYDNQRRLSTINHSDAAVYAIRDIEFVCTVCVGLSNATYCPGDIINLCLDFEKNVQVS